MTRLPAVLLACVLGCALGASAAAHDLGAAYPHEHAEDRPPPAENDPDDFVRYIFESNACLLTEAQLFEIYMAEGYGIGGTNDAVIAVSNREDVELISRDPFLYRYVGSEFCGF